MAQISTIIWICNHSNKFYRDTAGSFKHLVSSVIDEGNELFQW